MISESNKFIDMFHSLGYCVDYAEVEGVLATVKIFTVTLEQGHSPTKHVSVCSKSNRADAARDFVDSHGSNIR